MRRNNPRRLIAAMVLLGGCCAAAQTAAPAAKPVAPAVKTAPKAAQAPDQGAAAPQIVPEEMPTAGAGDGVLVDQVIAVVNGDLILESDVTEERRFQAFQPLQDTSVPFARASAIERLVDRALILEQAKLQPDDQVTLEEAKTQLVEVRKQIPACQSYHCETEAGWEKFCRDQGFTVAEVNQRWRERMQLLRFVEERFRMGIRITPEEIKEYYDKTLLPQFARQKSPAPKLDAVSAQVQEVLLQKKVSALLDDWLATLKAQGSVRMMKPRGATS